MEVNFTIEKKHKNLSWFVYKLLDGKNIKYQANYNTSSYNEESSLIEFKRRLHDLGFPANLEIKKVINKNRILKKSKKVKKK